MDLTPERIFTLFFKYPISRIPIASGDQIHAFISKEKTLREASSTGFFQMNLENLLERVIEKPILETFFASLDQSTVVRIPIVDWETMKIRTLPYNQFHAEFQPLLELETGDFKTILEESEFPLFVVNSKKKVIYKNKKISQLTKLFFNETGVRRQSIVDYLPKDFFPKEIVPEKTYQLKMKSGSLKYKLQEIHVEKGNAEAVIFID